ncbi:MAG TPA: DNA ligase D, partial [Gemmatimonadaceae bacterium]|nr:DNA ligase D [Gemmatimonadaceae bacterium]
FVIQKHHASHLHFDLRLEVDGVMKSWAVPKGPSRDPSVKRLAMQVEDHPIAYNSFEGTIPKGEYGGGTVMIWDRGTYTSPEGGEEEIRRALDKGSLKFTLDGARLRGTWTLVRMRQTRQWLLIKHHDDADVLDDTLPSDDVESVVSGRRMSEIADGSAPVSSPAGPMPPKAGKKRRAPVSDTAVASSLLPMLATAATELPVGGGWAFEPKYDGVRVLAFADGDAVALVSRNGYDKAAQFPEIASALRDLGKRARKPFVLDGEIVARHGRTIGRFQDLQQRIGQTSASIIERYATEAPTALAAFDLLLDGTEPLVDQAWTQRRRRLQHFLKSPLPPEIVLGEAEVGAGDTMLARAKTAGWEGIMAKRVDATYTPGERTKSWRKIKIEGQQELVVGGWSEPRRSRQHVGALLVGYWHGDDFVYAGRVGGGFTQEGLAEMLATLRPLERKTPPFAATPPRSPEPVHWVKPEIVVEVKFNEWTSDGRLRQPIFLGVRDDKDPRAVVREPFTSRPHHAGVADTDPTNGGPQESPPREGVRKQPHTPSREQSHTGASEELREIEAANGKGRIAISGEGTLEVTNLGKIYFPEVKRTKGDVFRYYERAAPALLPIIRDRPLVLKRYPDGVGGQPFFQQNAPDDPPAGLRVETVPSESTPGRRIVGGNLFTLLYCVQLGCIDVNPWQSRVGSLACPDYTVLDLDPGPKATFAAIVRVARTIKDLLDAAKLTAAVKTSGSRGLHIVIPLPPRTNEEAARLVAQILAEQTVMEMPKEATTIRSRRSRPPATVYVDYLQNIVGKSVASAFSVRPRPTATVSAPLSWDEVTAKLDPDRFTMESVVDELEERAAIWTDAMSARNRLDALS